MNQNSSNSYQNMGTMSISNNENESTHLLNNLNDTNITQSSWPFISSGTCSKSTSQSGTKSILCK